MTGGCVQSAPGDPTRFRVEVQFSNGCNNDPRETKVMDDRPRTSMHRGSGVSLQEVQQHLQPWGSLRDAIAPVQGTRSTC